MSQQGRPTAHLIWSKVTTKVGDKTILDNVSGDVRHGQFLSIMGPSGAGKTSMLNILSDRFPGSGVKQTDGELMLNGRNVKDLPYKFITAFVPQEDILIETLTVKETLMFSANIALRLEKPEKEARVQQVLEDLGLTVCQDVIIGGVMRRGVSGGQKKRASIGYELITDPSVLFLDEPTTGLDAYTALLLVQLLCNLAKNNDRTVIATIHQPTSEIFLELDQLCLMSSGKVVYQGGAIEAVHHFENLGYPIKRNYNPSDHLMTLLCEESPDYPEPLLNRIQTFADIMSKKTEIVECEISSELVPYAQADVVTKYRALVWRTAANFIRNPILIKGKIFKQIAQGIILCAVFWQLGFDQPSIQDRRGLLMLLGIELFMDSLFTNLGTFQANKPLFIREYSGRKYSTLTYYLSQMTFYVPFDMFFSAFFVAAIYYIVGLNYHPGNYFKSIAINTLLGMSGLCFSNLVSILTPTIDISMIVVQAVNAPFILCAGLLVNVKDIGDWFFIKYFSPFRYFYEAAFINEFDNLTDMSTSLSTQAVAQMNFPDSFDDAMAYLCAIVGSLFILNPILFWLVNQKF